MLISAVSPILVNVEIVLPIIISLIALGITLSHELRQREDRVDQRNQYLSDLFEKEEADMKEWVGAEISEIEEKLARLSRDLTQINTSISKLIVELNGLNIKFKEHIGRFSHESALPYFHELNIWKSRIETILFDLRERLKKFLE